jgi:hypothetical protein
MDQHGFAAKTFRKKCRYMVDIRVVFALDATSQWDDGNVKLAVNCKVLLVVRHPIPAL